MDIPENLTLYRYVYRPVDVVLELGGENYTFEDGAVTYINIIHQYTRRHMPVVKMGLQTEIKIIRLIYDNKADAKITFKINEEKIGEDDEILDTTEYLSHTFNIVPVYERSVYITSDDEYDQSKSQDESGEEDREGEVETMRTYQNFEFYVVDLDVLNKFDMEYSDHLVNVSYPGILQKLFMVREIDPDSSFCTPPVKSDEKLKDVVISLGDFYENIYEMNNKYGMYDSQAIIYWDMFNYYCLNLIKPDIEYPDATDYGTVTFILLNPEVPDREVTGSYDDPDTRTHWINLQYQPTEDNNDTRDTNVKLSTLMSVNSAGEINENTLDDEQRRIRYIYAQNDLTEKQVLNATMHGPIRAVSMQNVSLKFFKPYKDYTFVTDTSYADLNLDGHIHRILNLVIDIQRVGSTEYRCTQSVVMYLPERQE